ncbi:hypothetical protein [Paenibacillus sp. UASWS1643]|uniref:hypothetical protein n=1 Tax=Paenibacillus sp. UASWS1643 TaxID=2580422 RepID=UPI00123BE594|nr:hypothetical protein [Paenibacillus sp. UASWS1643]KAA8753344.1 hypothetical protein FE296_12535 [Paenibacillus sp. UASWS1643]
MSPKIKMVLIIFVSLVLLVSGCAITYQVKNNNIVKKATPIAIEYFKSKYNVTVKFTDSQVFPGYIDSKVVLYGYVEHDVNETFSIAINYNTYEVNYVTGPDWMFESD